jgi:hypothetical protein
VELLPVLILCGVCALQVVCIARLRRALFAAEERAGRFRQLFSDTVRREMSLRECMFMEQVRRERERLTSEAIHQCECAPLFIPEEIERQTELERLAYMRSNEVRVGEVAANPDILNSPAAVAIREAAQRAGLLASMDPVTGLVTMRDMTQEERAEAAPPARLARPEPPDPALHEAINEAYRDMHRRLQRVPPHIEARRIEDRRRLENMVTRGMAFPDEETRTAFLQSVLRGNVPCEPLAHDRHAAEARGVAWLKSCLSPEQLADYDRTRSFTVFGGTTGHRYRICWGISQNIIRTIEMLDGRELPVERLCFGPRGVPIGDILLHQKIALEGDEEAALRIAGRSPVVGQRLRMPADYVRPGPPADPDRASGFGWNVYGRPAGEPVREEFYP